MKKTFLLILIVLMFTELHSQITKRNWMLGGSISYSSTSYRSTNFGIPHKYYNLQIKPNIAYFFADKFAAGLKAGIVKEGDPSSGTGYTDFNIGPCIRYYFLGANRILNIVSEGIYQYGFISSPNGNNTTASKNNFVLSAGPVIYFNETVGLEFLVSYSTYKFSGVKGNNNTIMFGLGLQVHLRREES